MKSVCWYMMEKSWWTFASTGSERKLLILILHVYLCVFSYATMPVFVNAQGCVSTMKHRVGFEGLRLSSEVGRGLRASAGSPVITADVECLQRDEEG